MRDYIKYEIELYREAVAETRQLLKAYYCLPTLCSFIANMLLVRIMMETFWQSVLAGMIGVILTGALLLIFHMSAIPYRRWKMQQERKRNSEKIIENINALLRICLSLINMSNIKLLSPSLKSYERWNVKTLRYMKLAGIKECRIDEFYNLSEKPSNIEEFRRIMRLKAEFLRNLIKEIEGQ